MDNTKQQRVLTIKRAAFALAVSERTLWRMISKEEIKVISLSERRRGIPLSEIERITTCGVAV
ncbi:hypothetical protein [Bradyrhizobium sp. G127]|uniref:helix-turn-helix transcriptional regulator n=1 Tax=Bradyrhizobium sp. G127 TaxID=2904800 RepID=UPI001F413061|nr:hypothetical protein [Bradyrhizobium sp. G127]MCF2523903.1 hypothetical protein [Bradyrhizobium sp. G127]